MAMTFVRVLLAVVGATAVLSGFEEARSSITAEEIRAHLYLLSSDELEGRAPGSRGGRVAARYIESRFMAMGLEPVNGSYFQEVPLVGIDPDPGSVSVGFESGDDRLTGRFPADLVVWPGAPDPTTRVDGELVFVGYGIDAPAWDWDDFEGRDLRGKVLLILVGDPPAPPDEPGLFHGRALTYYGRWTHKLEEARRRGAAGALILHDAVAAGYDWQVVRSSWTGEQLRLAEEDQGSGGPPVRLQGWITQDFGRRLLGLAGLDLDELFARAARRDFRPVATGITVQGRMESAVRRAVTRNVVGLAPGRDPQRSGEVVILTSHYDHLGIGPAVDGDSIYNGAYDNASGVSLLLEIADAFARLDDGTDRGVLFVATAAEESGLLGARHYVRRPLFPLRRTAAVINVDGANLWGATDDIIPLGADQSTLGDLMRPRADEMALDISPDPDPETGGFFRSDHFPFARAGVPALFIRHGVRFRDRPEGWGAELMERFQDERYHRPSDEYDPDADLAGAVQQARFIFSVGYDVANAETAPEWVESSPFAAAREQMTP